MMVHSLEASPRVGRALDRGAFELLSSVRRCIARLWCCATRMSALFSALSGWDGLLTSCAHVPSLGHVYVLLDSDAEFSIVWRISICFWNCSREGGRLTSDSVFRLGVTFVCGLTTPQVRLIVRLFQYSFCISSETSHDILE